MKAKKPGSPEVITSSAAPLRGEALVRQAIEAAGKKGRFPRPEPVPAELLDLLRLPNGEALPASLRALLAFDAAWLGMGIDLVEAEIEALDLEDLIAVELGEELASGFAEAYEILSDDCLLLGGGSSSRSFLYVGNPDAAGEYAVITVDAEGTPWVGGFVPFDVWVAQQLGALPSEGARGKLPPAYAGCAEELARLNGDGRTSFEPEGEED